MGASQAIPRNIAEGNGKGTDGGRRRYFEIARRPALECGAVKDVSQVYGGMTADQNVKAKALLDRIVVMPAKLGQRGYAVDEEKEENARRRLDAIMATLFVLLMTGCATERNLMNTQSRVMASPLPDPEIDGEGRSPEIHLHRSQ